MSHPPRRMRDVCLRRVDGQPALRRGSRVDRYMRPVDAAITAYREWEQLARLAWGTDAYADLLAHAHAEPAGGLPHDLTGDFALRETRDAIDVRVREAHEAADWLATAARSDV